MLTRTLLCIALIVTCVSAAMSVPVEKTRYGKAALRVEMRPNPFWVPGEGLTFESFEKGFADAGVQTQWLSVVDPLGNPYYVSKYIPSLMKDLDRQASELARMVDIVHKNGLAVMSWYPLILNQACYHLRPEWRQIPMDDPAAKGVQRDWECCINTGYGDALIDFCNEAIDKFGLDGFWFDGSAWTQIWHRPVPLTCLCDGCRRRFKAETGLDLPTKVNWSDPVFRKWVAWRYDSFSAYIGRLARAIRAKHPYAAVAINHYHRPLIPWQSAIPLNPYDADIITGSEGSGEDLADLTMRLCTAYGRPQSEVWMPIPIGDDPSKSPETDRAIHHALTCMTAGGFPSYGFGGNLVKGTQTLKYVQEYLAKAAPYVSSKSVPYAAIHLSQQSETFYFSRDRKGLDWVMEPYWRSVMSWTQGLMQAHIAPDYVYDKQFTPANLKKYKLLILPMSIALSDEQCRTVVRFAEHGGVVVLGPGTGAADEWGELRKSNPLETHLGLTHVSAPSPAGGEMTPISLTGPPDDAPRGPWSSVLAMLGPSGPPKPWASVRTLGKGKVVVVTADPGADASGWTAMTGGDASITFTDETAAKDKQSLKFVDGPNVEQSFLPDMEMRYRTFGSSNGTMGRLTCALMLEPGAQVSVESRHQSPVKLGPSVHIGRDGRLWARDVALCDVPFGKWFGLTIDFRMAGNATYDVTLAIPGATSRKFTNLPYIDQDFAECDWTVIYGEGTERSSFYLDDLKIESVPAKGPVTLVLQDDFESGVPGSMERMSPVQRLADRLKAMSPDPIICDAPAYIRVGAYALSGSETAVHIHNTRGSRVNSSTGVPVTVRLSAPVKSARSVFTGKDLAMVQKDGRWEVQVPPVGMYDVVVLKR